MKKSIDANWLSSGVDFDFRAVSVSKASFNCVHPIHTGLMNAFHSANLFTSSCHYTSTNGKAPPHSHIKLQEFLYSSSIRPDDGITLEKLAF